MPNLFPLLSLLTYAQASPALATTVTVESPLLECPSTGDVRQAIAHALGQASLATGPSPGWRLWYARAVAAPELGDAALTLRFSDPSGRPLVERQMPAAMRDCPALATAVAAIVERSLRALGWSQGLPLPPSAAPLQAAEPPAKPGRHASPPVVVAVGPGWATSAPAGNLLLALRARLLGPLALDAGGALLSGTRSESVGNGTARLTTRPFSAALLLAWPVAHFTLAAGPSLLVRFEQAHSQNLDQVGDGGRATLALGGTLAPSWTLSPRWRLGLRVAGYRASAGSNYVVTVGGARRVVLAPPSWEAQAAAYLEFAPWP